MYEVPPPRNEGRSLISKDFPIPLSPYVPSSSENHISEERITKIPPSSKSHLICALVRLGNPRDPKVIPNPLAEVASKEKMGPIPMLCKVAKNTSIILDDPLSTLHHIPGVQMIH